MARFSNITAHVQVAMICGGPRADNFFKTIWERTFHGYMTLIGKRKILQYGDPQLSRQNQKHFITAKTKYLTAKPKTSRVKQNTSRQNQKPHGKTKYFTAKTK